MVEAPDTIARPRVILLSGIPASGKSSLGKYLGNVHGVVHVDAEEPGELAIHGLQTAWDALFASGSAEQLVHAASRSGAPCVLDWGFPPSCLAFVASMKAAGIEPWWCDGDREAAHRLYRARPSKNSEADWQRQMEAITLQWPAIQALFGDRILETVRTGPALRPFAETATTLGFVQRRS